MAISNHRITLVDNQTVSFTYKGYRHGGRRQQSQLSHGEFIRRFAMHILPRGFVRIRHYGILSSSAKVKSLPAIRAQMPEQVVTPMVDARQTEPYKPGICLHCKTPGMVTVETLPKRGPPALTPYREYLKNNH